MTAPQHDLTLQLHQMRNELHAQERVMAQLAREHHKLSARFDAALVGADEVLHYRDHAEMHDAKLHAKTTMQGIKMSIIYAIIWVSISLIAIAGWLSLKGGK